MGDGTTSVIILAGALCRNAQTLVERGAHRWAIIQGFQTAVKVACEVLNGSALLGKDVEGLHFSGVQAAVCISLGESVMLQERQAWAQVCIDAVNAVTRGAPFDSGRIRLATMEGTAAKGLSVEKGVRLVHGVVLCKSWAQGSAAPLHTPCTAAVLSCALEPPR